MSAGASRPEIGRGSDPRRGAGLRLLYRLQRAEDAAYRASGARHHGCARHLLSRDGRTELLLRGHASTSRRHRDVGPDGSSTMEKMSHSKSGVLSWCPSCFVQFTERRCRRRKADRFAALRYDAIHPLPLRPAGGLEAASATPVRCASRCTGIPASPAWWKPRRSAGGVPGIEFIDLRQPAVGLQSFILGALPAFKRELQQNELEAAARPASMRWSRSIIPTIANYARMSATGRSASSTSSSSSARAWACSERTVTSNSS